MKNSLLSFADAILSRDQMKRVVGGTIYCVTTTNYGGGTSIKQGGKCSGSSPSDCQQMAKNNCGGQSCSSTCYYG